MDNSRKNVGAADLGKGDGKLHAPVQSWFWRGLFGLDRWLRRRYGVFEYTSSPRCIFRLSIIVTKNRLELADGTCVEPGERLGDLHLWNEQLPILARTGPPLAWALEMNRRFPVSLRELACYLCSNPKFQDIRAIRAMLAFGAAKDTTRLIQMSSRYGFEPLAAGDVPALSPLHLLGENLLISLMVLARNKEALRLDSVRRVRIPVFLSRSTLERRFMGQVQSGHPEIALSRKASRQGHHETCYPRD